MSRSDHDLKDKVVVVTDASAGVGRAVYHAFAPNQPDNLFQSVPGSFNAHGRFDDRAKKSSTFFLFSKYRMKIYFLLLAIVVTVSIIIML